jgi:hypothetical protein
MRTSTARAGALGALGLALVGCAAAEEPVPVASPGGEGEVITETVPAPSLANNVLGDPAEREIMVYLPPSYATSETRYPVVYFLAGYEEHIGMFAQHDEELWAQMLEEGSSELIVVEVDGISALGGNFYANSPVSGNAEDFLTRDLVEHIDSTYRTIPEASARGLSGFSMGGSGTVNVGLANPDVYAALYAHSPGLLHEDGGLVEFLQDNGAWRAYGATFAPDVDAPAPHMLVIDAHAPLEGQDPAIVAAWESGYGNLRAKIADYLAQPERLVEIKVAYGTTDIYGWIPTGSAYFLDLLEESGIPGSEYVFEGGHGVAPFFFQSDCVDFFSRTLSADGATAED